MVTITLKHSETRFWKGKLRTWFELLRLAEGYGWKPSGSVRPRDYAGEKEWDEEYHLPCGQIVSADDAGALGEALRLALTATSTLMTKEARKQIAEFVELCKQGEFELLLPGTRNRRCVAGKS